MVERLQVGERMSQAVIHNGVIYLAGQVARDKGGAPVAEQTENILSRIERLLDEAGADKSKIVSATIWLADISNFDEMNRVWDAWVPVGNTPARACIEAKLSAPQWSVEIGIIAAL